MPATPVFNEPSESCDGPFDGVSNWLQASTSLEARMARNQINASYAGFSDRSEMVLSRLRGDNNAGVYQALDELYVHHLLSRACEARYEEDETSPDFRLYQTETYLAGVEVRTLFGDKAFDAEMTRNARLAAEINRRVRPTAWFVALRVINWNRQPRVTDIARWLKDTVATLPEPTVELTSGDYPAATYRSKEIQLAFEFLPRHRKTERSDTDTIVIAGPPVVQFVKPTLRLRNALSQKAGSKYNHRDRPFAVAVSVRDLSCDTEDVVNALYGDDVITFDVGDPHSSRADRKRNGTFGISPSNPDGRNTRLGCVFVMMRGWTPGSNAVPTIIRFDNPFAKHPFPDDLLVPDRRFVARRSAAGVYMEWEPATSGL
jgi:hypothetical protein